MKLPEDFKKKYRKLLGEEADDFFASLDNDVERSFHLNPLKQNYRNVDMDLSHPIKFITDGYYGNVSGKTLDHQAGYVYSQDASAMYVAQNAGVQPGDKVLDLCAAPGGKSSQLAAQLQNEGLLVSNEINPKRARILAENMERIGAHNTVVLNESPEDLEPMFKHYFDKIIVDAPCSGEGMFRKNHDAVKYWNSDYPAECALRQKKILESAMKMLAPDGILVYSTCTFAPEEDEQIASWLLDNYQLEMLEIPKSQGMISGKPDFSDGNLELEKSVRMMPHLFKGEGQFIAKFHNTNNDVKKAKMKRKKGKKQRNAATLDPKQRKEWNEFAQSLFGEDIPWGMEKASNLRLNGNYLYLYEKEWPDISKLKFERPGLLLGEFKKNRFEPAYALALALHSSLVFPERIIQVQKSEWQQYAAGNVLAHKEKKKNGWYLLECEEKLFAFGKLVNGQIKNFFPKGLRIRA